MIALFDIGGRKTRIALSRDGASLEEPVKLDTPEEYETGLELIAHTIRELSQGEAIQAAGGGIAGPLNTGRTMLVRSPNLPNWVNKPFVEDLSSRLGAPVYIENDSAVVALGEAHHGAGKGDPIMAYITVSTGVGGVRIVHGKIDEGAFGFEPGHQYIDFDHTACPECQGTDIEQYISGTATEKRFHIKPYEVESPEVWEELARCLAIMLNNTIVHWSPHSVVLGGSMIVGDPAIPVDRVAHHLDKVCTIFPQKPLIKKALLADLGGLYGAMELVRSKVA